MKISRHTGIVFYMSTSRLLWHSDSGQRYGWRLLNGVSPMACKRMELTWEWISLRKVYQRIPKVVCLLSSMPIDLKLLFQSKKAKKASQNGEQQLESHTIDFRTPYMT